MNALIRYRESSIISTESVAVPGTFGTSGTVSVDNGIMTVGGSDGIEVLQVLALPDGVVIPAGLVEADYWSWSMFTSSSGGVSISIKGNPLGASVEASASNLAASVLNAGDHVPVVQIDSPAHGILSASVDKPSDGLIAVVAKDN